MLTKILSNNFFLTKIIEITLKFNDFVWNSQILNISSFWIFYRTYFLIRFPRASNIPNRALSRPACTRNESQVPSIFIFSFRIFQFSIFNFFIQNFQFYNFAHWNNFESMSIAPHRTSKFQVIAFHFMLHVVKCFAITKHNVLTNVLLSQI